MDIVLQTQELSKVYKNCTALDHVSLRLLRGHIYGLIGSNGAGKSTLFHILAGLLRPTAGSYSILGATSEQENRLARRRIGFVFSSSGLSEHMTAVQNLMGMQKLKGYSDHAEALELLERVGLEPIKTEHEQIHTYSTGQRQRVAIAAALLGKPELLILDEPLVGLDPEAIRLVHKTLRQEQAERDVTILISSHNLPQLEHLASDFLLLHCGRLLKESTQADLCETELEEYFLSTIGDAP